MRLRRFLFRSPIHLRFDEGRRLGTNLLPPAIPHALGLFGLSRPPPLPALARNHYHLAGYVLKLNRFRFLEHVPRSCSIRSRAPIVALASASLVRPTI